MQIIGKQVARLAVWGLLGLTLSTEAALAAHPGNYCPPNDSDAAPRNVGYQFRRHSRFNLGERFPSSNLHDAPIDVYDYDVAELDVQVPIPLRHPDGEALFVYPLPAMRKTSGFGQRGYRFHYGTDFGLEIGDTIVSAMEGIVRVVRVDRYGYGNFIVVAHKHGIETLYGHLSRPLVQVGQHVRAGEVLGLGGSTGRSTGPHLHFETRFMGEQFNPEHIMSLVDSSLASDQLALNNTHFNHLRRHPHRAPTYTPGNDAAPAAAGTLAPQLASNGNRVHIVRSGDTLGHIAGRYGTTVTALCRTNGLRPTSILNLGQRIRIP